MKKLIYLKGDITNPIFPGVVIAHVVNDIGLMGSGVAKALYEKWPHVKWYYHKWHETQYRSNAISDYCPFELGKVQFVHVDEEKNIIVCNMIAQHSTISMGEKKPIRYDALKKCLEQVNTYCLLENITLHMPKIGSGLARGDWNIIEQIIKDEMKVDTYIYEWKE